MNSSEYLNYSNAISGNNIPNCDRDEGSNPTSSPSIATVSAFSSPDLSGGTSSSATSHAGDPHAVSDVEAKYYYYGLPSEPRLIYRTSSDQSQASGPQARWQRRPGRKVLCPVFGHPLADLWNDGMWREIVKATETHVFFTTLDVVRFKVVEDGNVSNNDDDDDIQAVIGPVTIWVGVPKETPPTHAHDAAQDILALLKNYSIMDVNVEFRVSYYYDQAGPQLIAPAIGIDALFEVASPLTPTLGLGISAETGLNSQGTMCLYLNEGGDRGRLLGLTCRHVLFGPNEPNAKHTFDSLPTRNVVILGTKAYKKLVTSINDKVRHLVASIKYSNQQMTTLPNQEGGIDADDPEGTQNHQVDSEQQVQKWWRDIRRLQYFLRLVKTQWKNPNNRMIGSVVYSPPIGLGVGKDQFTEDWAIFEVNRNKLGNGFQGNRIDLGATLTSDQFEEQCIQHPSVQWQFVYPVDHRLPIRGILTRDLMLKPDMRDQSGETCLLVVKHGNTSKTTLGRANGVMSIVRRYQAGGIQVAATSMEWCIMNAVRKSTAFSTAGDSGSAIVDIRGRIGGKLSGGGGATETTDVTYATPFWWELERIKDYLPNVHLGVV